MLRDGVLRRADAVGVCVRGCLRKGYSELRVPIEQENIVPSNEFIYNIIKSLFRLRFFSDDGPFSPYSLNTSSLCVVTLRY